MIDNAVCSNATLVKVCFYETQFGNPKRRFDFVKNIDWLSLFVQVDSARRHGILLEAVQVLTDLNLTIKKAYISSDGRWFMDGKKFHNFC